MKTESMETTTSYAWRDFSTPVLPPVLSATLDCFVESGYHGTTTRTISKRTGLSVPGLYYHYPSKQALLVAIMRFAMSDLLTRSRAALREAGDSIEDRAGLLVECLVLFHAHRSDLAFIASSEIRSLESDAREAHIAARDRQQRMLNEVIDEGVANGTFSTPYPRDTSRAIVTMCTGVAQWYRSTGPLDPDDLAQRYCAIARATLGPPSSAF